jgi:hypothetical protein
LKLPSGKRLKKAVRNVFRTTAQGFRSFTDGALREPKKFVMIISLVIIAILLSYFASLCLWMLPLAAFIFFLFVGVPKSPRRRSKRFRILEISISVFLAAIMALLCTLGFMIFEAGNIHEARIPPDYLEPKTHNGWEEYEDFHYEEALALSTVRIITNGYRFYGDTTPPYEGLILVLTAKRVPAVSAGELEDIVEDRLKGYEGLELNRASRTTGSRQIFEGHTTHYFEYNAKLVAEGSDPITSTFMSGAKVKIRGEFWYCDDHGTTVGAIGGAQYGYDFEEGQYVTKLRDFYTKERYPDDYRTWTTVTNLIQYTDC